jgi:hypothetical protein
MGLDIITTPLSRGGGAAHHVLTTGVPGEVRHDVGHTSGCLWVEVGLAGARFVAVTS